MNEHWSRYDRQGIDQHADAVKPKFHYADFLETSPDAEVSGKSA